MYVGLWACRSTNWWVQQIDVLGWQFDAQCGGLWFTLYSCSPNLHIPVAQLKCFRSSRVSAGVRARARLG